MEDNRVFDGAEARLDVAPSLPEALQGFRQLCLASGGGQSGGAGAQREGQSTSPAAWIKSAVSSPVDKQESFADVAAVAATERRGLDRGAGCLGLAGEVLPSCSGLAQTVRAEARRRLECRCSVTRDTVWKARRRGALRSEAKYASAIEATISDTLDWLVVQVWEWVWGGAWVWVSTWVWLWARV